MKVYVYELVPTYVPYRKLVEVESLAEAQALIEGDDHYSDIDGDEEQCTDGAVIEALPVKYEVEAADDD